MNGLKKTALTATGWATFGLGFIGIFLPGLPTTIFWIVAALCFLKTNERMYRRITADKRFGPGIKLFVEEGKISARGKWVSITAMMLCASLGALAIPLFWVKILVVASAGIGSLWVWVLPTPKNTRGAIESAANKD